MVRVTRRETASQLLGKRISICYPHPKEEPQRSITQRGRIAGVRFHPFEDSTIHVKFDALLPEGLLEHFERIFPPLEDHGF
jgi:ribosomal protein L35AE/L33A